MAAYKLVVAIQSRNFTSMGGGGEKGGFKGGRDS